MGRAFEYRKARMFKRWGNMSRTFTRLGKEITMAVKVSGPDPQNNSKLRLLLQNAKHENMPKDTIDRAIKRATEKDTKDYKEVVYEGYGAHGVAVLIETATDNTTRTVANIRTCFNKNNGSLGTTGMLDFIFDRQCSFTVATKPELDIEEFELELIDFNVDEVFEEEGELMIFAEFQSFGPIQKYLEENDFEIKSFKFERIPNDTKELTEEQKEEVFKLIDKIEEDDDVTNVFHNIKM